MGCCVSRRDIPRFTLPQRGTLLCGNYVWESISLPESTTASFARPAALSRASWCGFKLIVLHEYLLW